MDNTLSEIRRKIKVLRVDMLDLQQHIRGQVDRSEDCEISSRKLMGMSRNMIGLIRIRNAMGGDERLLTIEERLKSDYRTQSAKSLKSDQLRR